MKAKIRNIDSTENFISANVVIGPDTRKFSLAVKDWKRFMETLSKVGPGKQVSFLDAKIGEMQYELVIINEE